jgi:hypothetical protein
MGATISAVRNSALNIVSSSATLGDVRFGVGEYKDVGDVFVYRTNTDLTNSSANVVTAINKWIASGGGDLFEANLFALEQVAKLISWRAGSTRILVWFGDAPGHDPSASVTEATAINALVAHKIVVEALDVGSLNGTGQASRIASATGGTFYPSVNTSSIVNVIKSSISTAIEDYSRVELDLSGVPSGLSATTTPAFSGSYHRDVARTFEFDVTFTGTTEGTYDFEIPVLVDSGKVATERDSIVVGTGGGSGGGSATPPSCALTSIVAGPPRQLIIAVQDADDGVERVEVTTANNSDVTLPVFSPGETGALVVTATKLDPGSSSQVALRITDIMGTVTDCDPIVPGSSVEAGASLESAGAGGCSLGGSGRDGLSAVLPTLIALLMVRRRRQSRAV